MKYNGESGYNEIDTKKKIPILGRIDFNSPVILGFAIISLLVLAISELIDSEFAYNFAITKTSWLDPMMYLRMFTHIFSHSSPSHFANNFLLILTIGPMVEEKYGSKTLALLIFITAGITGLINVTFFPNTMLLGASGIAFMLIVLGSFTNVKVGKIPLTVILVSVIYIGNEIITGLTYQSNVSNFGHALGGLCGAGFGYLIHGRKMKGYRE